MLTTDIRLVGRTIAIFAATSAIAICGASFGANFVSHDNDTLPRPTFDRLTAWDGRWYHDLVELGYMYDAAKPSNVAFFPLYPILVRAFSSLGISIDAALILVANGSFALSCVLMIY